MDVFAVPDVWVSDVPVYHLEPAEPSCPSSTSFVGLDHAEPAIVAVEALEMATAVDT